MAKWDFVPDLPTMMFKAQSAEHAAKAAKAARLVW
jgi:hypothetical protein